MNDGPCESTPKHELEKRVMDVNVPKSETEWWAQAEIKSLREGVRQIGEQWNKCQDMLEAQHILIREQAAELRRLKVNI